MLSRKRKNELLSLLDKYIQGKTSLEETAFVEKYSAYFDNQTPVSNSLSEEEKAQLEEKILNRLHARINKKAAFKVVPLFKKYIVQIAAAAVLVFLITGYWLLKRKPITKIEIASTNVKKDIAPGKSGAILQLANGQIIILDTARNGKLANNVIKNGESITVKGDSVEFATLTTPRARQQQLTLADGTQVWLNAASSIRFPTAFISKTRVVEITGEAYFEVVHNAKQAFQVKVGNQLIEDIGTSFNINAYTNEAFFKATLIEGSVKVSQLSTQASRILKPGEQAQIIQSNPSSKIIVEANADIDLALAWKNGMQSFSGADVQTVIRQIERWYDIDVTYEGTIPKRTFFGDIPRTANLSEILKLFEANNIHFTIDADKRKMIIKP